MKCREAGGHLGRVENVQVFVLYSDDEGLWLPITKVQARDILDDAAGKGREPEVEIVGSTMRIGCEHTIGEDEAAEGPHAVCSECEEPWTPDHACED